MAGCRFQLRWLEEDKYKFWILRCSSDSFAKCKLCQKDIDLRAMGESALRSHAAGKKHQSHVTVANMGKQEAISMKSFLTKENKPPSAEAEIQNLPSSASSSMVLSDFVSKEETLKAEIIWTLHTINSHNSFSSNSGINQIFQHMFPDSKIAKHFGLSDRKTSYLAAFGLEPYFTSLLEEKVKPEDFVLLFDESMNKYLQKKQMDFHIRLWDQDKVTTRFFTSRFLGHASAADMIKAFDDSTQKLNVRNMIQISMDGPNVNWSFHAKVDHSLETNHSTQLLNAGSCGLHKVHGACKTAMDATDWKLDKILKAFFILFHDTPARRDDFAKVTGTSTFPLEFCKHRWLENVKVAQRVLDVLEPVKRYVDSVMKGCSSDPATESFRIVKEAISDTFLSAKLAFFISLSKQVEPFLTEYQTDQPMLPFAHKDLNSITFSLLKRYCKPKKVESIKSTKDVLSFVVTDSENHVISHKVDIGFVAETFLNELKKCKKASELQVLKFRNECKATLVCFTDKFIAKSPLQYTLVRDMSCLNPEVILSSKAEAEAKLKRLLTVLVNKRRYDITKCDSVLREFSSFVDNAVSSGSLSSFSRKTDRLDKFFYDRLACQKEYIHLWPVVKTFLLLSHGQATVERGFSINKECEDVNLKERTLIARRVIVDSVRNAGGINMIDITPKMLINAGSAYSRYSMYLDEQRKKLEQERRGHKRKTLDEELAELKRKKVCTEKDIQAMTEAADNYAMKAETHRKISFITTSNSLRKSVKEKVNELGELEKQVDDKLQELKNSL